MFEDTDDENARKGAIPDMSKGTSAGQRLKKIFRQKDGSDKIEEQIASISMLMKPLRLTLFIHLCQNPCDHTRSMARSTGKSVSAVRWNLEQLINIGYLESSVIDGRKIYWPSGMIETRDLELVANIRRHWSKSILMAVKRAKGMARQRDIAKFVDANQQNIDFWLGRLVSAGILERTIKDDHTFYSIAPDTVAKVQYYEAKAREFSEYMGQVLRDDGLMPHNARFRGTRLSIDIKLPSGRKRLHFECHPMAPIRRFLR